MTTCVRAGVLALVLSAGVAGPVYAVHMPAPAHASVSQDQPSRFVARPGELEFSGKLIARPVQPAAARARGLADEAIAAAKKSVQSQLAGKVLSHFPEVDEYVISAPAAPGEEPGDAENRIAAQLMATGLFEYVVPDWTCYPVGNPNDPLFSQQWHHATMHCPQAWNFQTGDAAMILAVTDTGIDVSHPDLVSKRVPGYNSADRLAEVDGGQVIDINGHGTHVAGCATATGNNNIGVSGVNWNARIMMVRVTNSGNGSASSSDILLGARWAAEHGAKVVSSSYSGVESASVGSTGTYIRSLGSLYCYAAGNSSSDLASFDYPDVIVVGASDQGDNRAWFSSFGKAVDIFTPGVDILSTVVGGGYQAWSGTSMATPVTNGALGVIWSANPSLSAQQVETLLEYAADDLGAAGEDDTFGFGRVNLERAVQWAIGPSPVVATPDNATTSWQQQVDIDVLANDYTLNGAQASISAFDASTPAGAVIAKVAGPNGRDVLRYTPPAHFEGLDTLHYTAAGPGNQTATTTVTLSVYDPANFRVPDGPAVLAPGLDTSYYALNAPTVLPNFAVLTPIATTTTPNVNFPATLGVFAASGLVDNLGAVFAGYVTVPQDGFYTFYTTSDDGSALWIGDTKVVDNDGIHDETRFANMVEKSGVIGLAAGTHSIRIAYFGADDWSGCIVSYSTPTSIKQVIPASMFGHAACPADFDGSGFADFDDFNAFSAAFEAGADTADFDDSGFVDFDDFIAYVQAFEQGC